MNTNKHEVLFFDRITGLTGIIFDTDPSFAIACYGGWMDTTVMKIGM
jgi:hypothetical protein